MSKLDQILDLSEFEIGKYLGKGSFGKVYEVREKSTGKIYAAKISLNSIDSSNHEIIKDLLNEVNINASIDSPSILRFIGFNPKDFENKNKPVIITDLAQNGSLKEVIEYESRGFSVPGWDDTKKLITIFGIASGMSFLHKHNILHRDLKLENILLDDRLFPKIADFGISKKILNDGLQSTIVIKGTPIYLSPEIINKYEFTKAGDVYAFAIIVYEIMNAKRPYKGFTINQILKSVPNGYRPNIDKTIPESYCQLIKRCWSSEPKDRPTFDEIIEDLQTDKYLTPNIDNEDFNIYVEFIQAYRSTYDTGKRIISFEDIVKNYQSHTFEKVSVHNFTKSIKKKILPVGKYEKLNKNCQLLVDKSIDDPEKQFIVGKCFIEGQKDFPHDVEYGIKFLIESSEEGCQDAALYLSEIYLKGEFIPQDVDKAKEYLLKHEDSDDSRIFNALGHLFKKENQMNEARKYYLKGAEKFNPLSMFKYGIMLFKGEGGDSNINEAIKYLNLSKNQGFQKSDKFLNIYEKLNINPSFSKLKRIIQHFFINQIYKQNKNVDINEIIINKSIKLTGNDIENFYQNEILTNSNFIDLLSNFLDISVEIIYPNKNFSKILNQIEKIKSSCSYNFDISVFILNSINTIESSAFEDCSSLNQIIIPSSVSSIGSFAFSECSTLKKIIIPSLVTEILKSTFNQCSSLTEIIIPSSIKAIRSYAFTECTSLSEIKIPSSVKIIEKGAFRKCSSLKNIEIRSAIDLIYSFTFSKCSSLTQITIPQSVTKIKKYAFDECSSLTQITIPSSVTKIGSRAFKQCTSLVQITFEIPSSITSIGEYSFEQCRSLKSIIIPSSVTFIGKFIFNSCTSLKDITINSSLTLISFNAFSDSSLERITFETPSSINLIGAWAFSYCSLLKQIDIPKSVTAINACAFINCTALETVSIPASVTCIKHSSFYKCTSLKKISFDSKSSLEVIEGMAFGECSSLTEITFPSSLKSIEEIAFCNCTSLEKVKFESPSSITSIGNKVFIRCTSLVPFKFPSSVTEVGNDVFLDCKPKNCCIQ